MHTHDPEDWAHSHVFDQDQKRPAETRTLIPDWAKSYHPEDPGSLIVKVDWPWYNQHAEWISKSYERIVLG